MAAKNFEFSIDIGSALNDSPNSTYTNINITTVCEILVQMSSSAVGPDEIPIWLAHRFSYRRDTCRV